MNLDHLNNSKSWQGQIWTHKTHLSESIKFPNDKQVETQKVSVLKKSNSTPHRDTIQLMDE